MKLGEIEKGDPPAKGDARVGVPPSSDQRLGGFAHDVNNALTPIVVMTACLELELPPDHPLRPQIGDIRIAAERASVLVQRALSSLRQGPDPVAPVGLRELALELKRTLQALAGSGVTLELDGLPAGERVLADRHRLEAALVDLVVNARDAMAGHGTIRLRARPVELRVDAAARLGVAAGTFVELEITDTGAGMPQSVAEHVFERFYTTKSGGKSAGLGLWNVRRFADESGGAVTVLSAPERGTTFSLFLPRG